MSRILLLDDERSVLTYLRHLVARGHPDWEFTWVPTLPELETRVVHDPAYDLALIDLYLPATNWTEVLATALRLFVTIPVVVLTGAGELRGPCLALGAFGFVQKDDLVKTPETVAAYFTSVLDTPLRPPDTAAAAPGEAPRGE